MVWDVGKCQVYGKTSCEGPATPGTIYDARRLVFKWWCGGGVEISVIDCREFQGIYAQS